MFQAKLILIGALVSLIAVVIMERSDPTRTLSATEMAFVYGGDGVPNRSCLIKPDCNSSTFQCFDQTAQTCDTYDETIGYVIEGNKDCSQPGTTTCYEDALNHDCAEVQDCDYDSEMHYCYPTTPALRYVRAPASCDQM